MIIYGLLPAGGLIFAVAMVHAVSDGLTISSAGVAVSMVVPADRQAGAHGVIGAAQAISAGIMASVTGAIYGIFGQAAAYTVAGVVMIVLTTIGRLACPLCLESQRRKQPALTIQRPTNSALPGPFSRKLLTPI